MSGADARNHAGRTAAPSELGWEGDNGIRPRADGLSAPRFLFLLLTICLGLATIVKAAQVALTPETWAALVTVGERLLASSGFGFLLASTACLFLLSCSAAAWERAQRGEPSCDFPPPSNNGRKAV